jgi:hypothetical protein
MHPAAHQGTAARAGAENCKDVIVLFGEKKVFFEARPSQYYTLEIVLQKEIHSLSFQF